MGSIGAIALGTVLALAAIGGFYAVQRFGLARLLNLLATRMADSPTWQKLGRSAEALDREVHSVYARRRGLAVCIAWAMAAWLAGAVEVYLAMWALGLPPNVAWAFAFEAVGQGIRARHCS